MKFRLTLLLAAGLFAAGASLQAQFVWTGSSVVNGSVSDPTNWPAAGPGAPTGNGTETLQFGDLTGTQTNLLFATSAYATLDFLSGTIGRPTYTVSGTGATPVITLGGNLIVQAGNNVNFDNTVGLSLTSGNHTFDVASGTVLNLNGAISGAGALTLNNAGAFVLAGANTYSGGTTIDNGADVAVTGSISHPGANLLVGVTGGSTSTLGLAGGATVTDNVGRVGLSGPTTYGAVYADGAGTTWTNQGYLYVGEVGNGSVFISGGAVVTSANTSIGNNTGGFGTVTVDGVGSALNNSGNLYVGAAGNGSLSLTNGAHANNVTGAIGNNPGGSGFVTVDGAGSVWTNSGDLVVGGSGTGYLDVTNGAVVTSANGYLGTVAGITGQAYIDGAGSTWNLSNAVYVGYQGVSELLLSNGGSLTVAGGNGTVYLGYGAGSSGDLLIGNDGGPGGFVNAATVTTLSGMGTLDFETTNTVTNPYYFTKDGTAGGTPVVIAGATSVNAGSGYNVLNGANTYTGGTTILGGTLVAGSNGALGTGSVTFVSSSATLNVANGVTLSNALNLTNGGTLTGNGTIATPVAAGFGVFLSPGNSPGTLTFSNGLTLASGGTLTFQVQQAGGVAGVGYDLVNLTGGTLNITAIPTSRFTISVQSLDGTGAPGNVADFSSSSGYVWTIFSSSGGITGFNANEFTIDTSGFANSLGTGAFYVVQSGNQIQLDFSPVPEPSTYALFAAGLGLVGFVIRRRRLVRGG